MKIVSFLLMTLFLLNSDNLLAECPDPFNRGNQKAHYSVEQPKLPPYFGFWWEQPSIEKVERVIKIMERILERSEINDRDQLLLDDFSMLIGNLRDVSNLQTFKRILKMYEKLWGRFYKPGPKIVSESDYISFSTHSPWGVDGTILTNLSFLTYFLRNHIFFVELDLARLIKKKNLELWDRAGRDQYTFDEWNRLFQIHLIDQP